MSININTLLPTTTIIWLIIILVLIYNWLPSPFGLLAVTVGMVILIQRTSRTDAIEMSQQRVRRWESIRAKGKRHYALRCMALVILINICAEATYIIFRLLRSYCAGEAVESIYEDIPVVSIAL